MSIPFCLPLIDDDVIAEVNDVFKNTGWITSGPKVLELENEIQTLTNADKSICVNSWTSGAMLILRWFGVGPGDEVIIPSYTYAATALCVMNMGAKPVMVDILDDFTIDTSKLKQAINTKTKVVMPVDIGGWPADYDSIMEIISSDVIRKKFRPNSKNQKKLNRVLVISDAAHSLGAKYKSKNIGSVTDITIFSFHSVKNITTGEGGAICLKLPNSFDSEEEYKFLKALSLNGQNKSAFDKNKIGGWRYDIIDQGLKINMTDVNAAIGLAQIRKYKSKLLLERKTIFNFYNKFFEDFDWAILPISKINESETSYHLYMLRINNISESQRDQMIHYISSKKVGVNVHYIPMPMLTLFKNKNYNISNYPKTYEMYSNEISLPVYNNISIDDLEVVCKTVKLAYQNLGI
tara:strand:- start:5748 stop:6965 length:1218 start_codon:yes stop_codon:yes gene_type:complete